MNLYHLKTKLVIHHWCDLEDVLNYTNADCKVNIDVCRNDFLGLQNEMSSTVTPSQLVTHFFRVPKDGIEVSTTNN